MSLNVRPVLLPHFNLQDPGRHFTTCEYSECFCYCRQSCYQKSGEHPLVGSESEGNEDYFSLPLSVPSGDAFFPACFYLNSCFIGKTPLSTLI